MVSWSPFIVKVICNFTAVFPRFARPPQDGGAPGLWPSAWMYETRLSSGQPDLIKTLILREDAHPSGRRSSFGKTLILREDAHPSGRRSSFGKTLILRKDGWWYWSTIIASPCYVLRGTSGLSCRLNIIYANDQEGRLIIFDLLRRSRKTAILCKSSWCLPSIEVTRSLVTTGGYAHTIPPSTREPQDILRTFS